MGIDELSALLSTDNNTNFVKAKEECETLNKVRK